MKTPDGKLAAPFPYFGGKSRAVKEVWGAFGEVRNYVEPFAGSAAMLLGAPEGKRIETINDADGFIANFWRAVAADPEGVAYWADWPCNEIDLQSRHGWLVNRAERLKWSLEDPDFYDAKIAGWWCWGSCNWIGGEWCAIKGPWKFNGVNLYKDAPTEGMKRILPHLGNARGINRKLPHLGNARGINRKLPHLGDAGRGINRKLPHLGSAGTGINRQLPHLGDAGKGSRREFIFTWISALHDRLRDVRVTCGDWSRVVTPSVTTKHGLTSVFLDPPYTTANMDYAAGGVGGALAMEVQRWCAENGDNPLLRIVICGHAEEHDALLDHGWHIRTWKAGQGMARTEAAKKRRLSETLWCSPACCEKTGDA